MKTIENNQIRATINLKGAELASLFLKSTQTEFMWQADPTFWAKSSPVLFPIVGGLKNNSYNFEGKTYTLPRHGFARDCVFEVENQTTESITFLLKSDEKSLTVYPFVFEFRINYEVVENRLNVSYLVDNKGLSSMYFSVGGHPAFNVPIQNECSYEDYYLAFSENEKLLRYPLSADGLIIETPTAIAQNENKLHLSKSLFYEDALVLKNLQSRSITLKSDKAKNYLKFNFEGFPYFGIWAAKNANFVCLEPWCGIADGVEHQQELTQKEGINQLASGENFSRKWSAELN